MPAYRSSEQYLGALARRAALPAGFCAATASLEFSPAEKPGTGAQDLPKGTPQETIDKYDQLVEGGKWQDAVRILSREEYKAARQIEIVTGVCRDMGEARADLVRLRSAIADVAGKHGLAPIAASTHPFAKWSDQRHTDKERYDRLAKDLAGVARRLIICGLHVHVGIADEVDDGVPFGEKMSKLSSELKEYFKESKTLEEKIEKN